MDLSFYEKKNKNVKRKQILKFLQKRESLFIMLKMQEIAAAYRLSIESVQDKRNRAIAFGTALCAIARRAIASCSQLESLTCGVKGFLRSYEIFYKAES